MKSITRVFVIVILVFVFSNTAKSAIITEFFTSEVTVVQGFFADYFSVGDVFVTFDDKSLNYTEYYPRPYNRSADSTYYEYYSDATFDLTSIFNSDLLAEFAGNDNIIGRSTASHGYFPQESYSRYIANDYYGFSYYLNQLIGYSNWHYGSIVAWQENGSVDWNNSMRIDPVSAPVPEPATILLVSSGIIGLVGVSRRKKRIKA